METRPRLGLLQRDGSGPRSRHHVPRSLGLPQEGTRTAMPGGGPATGQGHGAAHSHPSKGGLSPREHTEQFWPICLKKIKVLGFFPSVKLPERQAVTLPVAAGCRR